MSAKTSLADSSLVRSGLKILLLFTIILVGSQITFVFRPLVVLFSTLVFPVLVAGALYYLANPLIQLLERIHLPRAVAILVMYVFFVLLLGVVILLLSPAVARQVERLIGNTPDIVREARAYLEGLQDSRLIQVLVPDPGTLDLEIGQRFGSLLSNMYQGIGENIEAFAGFAAGVAVVLTTVPFILFFMLKDGHKLPDAIVRFLPVEYRPEGRDILARMNETLAAFVQGQMLVSLFVGTFVYIGYTVIGLEYALLLAVVALVTNLIPYIGPIIGTIPGMVVGLLVSPFTMLQVIILVIIVQQIESQLISPLVMGKKLKIHPLTIIFVLLTAGSLAGFLGLLVGVPAYAVGRTAAVHGYKLYMLKMRADRKILSP